MTTYKIPTQFQCNRKDLCKLSSTNFGSTFGIIQTTTCSLNPVKDIPSICNKEILTKDLSDSIESDISSLDTFEMSNETKERIK